MRIRNTIQSAVLTLAVCGLTQAATITSTASSGPSLTDFSFSLVLNKFNPALGTLTGATIRFSGSDDITSLLLSNTSNSVQTFRYKSIADFLITGNTADNTLVVPQADLNFTFDTGLITLGPAGSGACPAATPSSACSNVLYDPAAITANTGDVAVLSLANYIGATTFTLSGQTFTGSSFQGGGGNINSTQATQGSVTALVTYTYTPATTGTPEPATMGLMGLSLLGLAALGRRK